MTQLFDLFGDPVPANHGGRGRPQHLPTQKNRNKVNMLQAFGWSNARITAALRVTQPTWRRHYFSELKCREVARDRLNAEAAMKYWKMFQEGNVPAGREFLSLVERNDLMSFRSAAAADKPRQEGIGAARRPAARHDAKIGELSHRDLLRLSRSHAAPPKPPPRPSGWRGEIPERPWCP
jgi:hypothetical protein